MTEEQIQENLQKIFAHEYIEQTNQQYQEVRQVALKEVSTIDWQALTRHVRSLNEKIIEIHYIGDHHSPNFLDGIFYAYGMFHDELHDFPLGYFVRHDQWARQAKQKRLTGSVMESIQAVFQGTLDEFLVTRIGIHEALQDSARSIQQLLELKSLEDSVYTPADASGVGFKHLPDEVKGKNYRLSEPELLDIEQQIKDRQKHQKSLDLWLKRVEAAPSGYKYILSMYGVKRLAKVLTHNAVEIDMLRKVHDMGVVPESLPNGDFADTGTQAGRIALNTKRKQKEKQSVSNVVRILETARENRIFSDETSMTDLAKLLWVDGVQYSGEKYSNLRGRTYNDKDKHGGKTDSSLFADFVYDCFEQMSAAKKKEFRERIKRPSE